MILWHKISLVISILAFIMFVLIGFFHALDTVYLSIPLGLILLLAAINAWNSYRETKSKFHLAEAIISALCVGVLVVCFFVFGFNP